MDVDVTDAYADAYAVTISRNTRKSFSVDSGQGRIDSVKINPSLLMMRKCTVTHWWNVGFTLRVPIWNVGTLK